MKKLIFIDNDSEKRSIEDLHYVKNNIKHIGNVPAEYVNEIEIVSNFDRLDREEAYKILFNPENAICSWSMYTATHAGSLFQMLRFLRAAGVSEVKNAVYIDGSGMLEDALRNQLRNEDLKFAMAILNAIENNYIISFDYNNDPVCFRLRLAFNGYYQSPFSKQPIDLNEILK